MAIPPKLFEGYDDERWRELIEAVRLATSLVDQASDLSRRATHIPLENWDVRLSEGSPPQDVFMKDLQAEVLTLRANQHQMLLAVRSLDAAMQVLIAKIKPLVNKNDKADPKRRRKSP